MALAKRIIPTILMRNGLMVKGQKFKANRVVGNAVQAARIHAMRGVDEILMLDVTATKEGREPDYAMVERLTSTATVPVTIGGGITELEHVRNLLASGADKVCIGSGKVPLLQSIADKFGKQSVAVTLDHDEVDPVHYTATLDNLYHWSADLQEWGAGEIILQCIPRDGTMLGYDLEAVKCIADYVNIPIVASGGCSGYDDMKKAFDAGASAVAVGALFQFCDATPQKAAQYLDSLGVEVRYEAG